MSVDDTCDDVAIYTEAPFSVVEVMTDPIAEVVVEVEGPRGPAGPEGPAGTTLGSSTEYVFGTPLYVWEGLHPYLGKPTVILMDENWDTILSSVTYLQSRYDENDPILGLVVLTFAVPMAGTLVIRA